MFAAIDVRSDITMTSVSDDRLPQLRQQLERGLGPGAQVHEHRVVQLAAHQVDGAFDGAHHLHAIAACACVGCEHLGERSILVDDEQRGRCVGHTGASPAALQTVLATGKRQAETAHRVLAQELPAICRMSAGTAAGDGRGGFQR